jgi:2-haloacid dehalogenase
MFGWLGRKRPNVVAFDIIGTVFSLEALRQPIAALGLPPSALEAWFAAALRDAFALAATGDFQPFTTVLEGALDQVLAEQGLNPPRGRRAAVIEQMERLSPRPDARQAFEALAAARIRIVALSNGSEAATRALLRSAGLEAMVERVVSVEDVRLFKPRREVYLRVARLCRVKPRRVALVAAHPWDIHGAKAAGLIAAYAAIERPFPPSLRAPDLGAASLSAVAKALAGR